MKACITYSWSAELNQMQKKMHRSVYNICQTLIAQWFTNHRQKKLCYIWQENKATNQWFTCHHMLRRKWSSIFTLQTVLGRSHGFSVHSWTCSCRSDADSKSCRFSDLSWCDSRLPSYYLHCEARVISRSRKLSCLFCSTRGTDNQPAYVSVLSWLLI